MVTPRVVRGGGSIVTPEVLRGGGSMVTPEVLMFQDESCMRVL